MVLRLNNKLHDLIQNKLKVAQLKDNISNIKGKFGDYTSDINDAHIVVGAKKARTRFLISYNLKHYKIEKIKQDLNIIIVTPAKLLQYLRSLE